MTKSVVKFISNFEKEEQWLNQMAAKGWHCIDYVFGRYLFEKGEPGEYIYRIQLLKNPINHLESTAYLNFLRETGVEVVASYSRWVYLRKKAADGPFDLFSDKESRIAHYKNIIYMFLPFAIMNLAFSLKIFTGQTVPDLIHVAAVVILSIPIARCYKRIRRLKKERLISE